MLLCCVDYLKRNSKMKNNEQHTFPFIERLLDGAEVEWKPLGEVAELKRGTSITKKTSTEGIYPVISGGQQPAYYIDKFNREGETLTVAGSGAYAGFVMYWNEPIFVSDAFSIKANEEQVLPRYIYHFLLNIQEKIHDLKAGGGVPHVYAKDVARFLIPIPCPTDTKKSLEIQRKLVEILDKFTELEAELEAELDCRKRQYEYYRNKLLAFDMLNTPPEKLNNLTVKTLEEVAEIKRGRRLVRKELSEKGRYAVFQNSMTPLGFYDKSNVGGDTTFIISAGAAGEIGYSSVNFWAADDIYYFIPITTICSKYLYHFLLTKQPTIKGQVRRASVPRLAKNAFAKIKIPLPPLSEQQRIVSILDKFDTLTSSISEGLPKEIELRRKQYEYYREQLLSFRH